MIYEIRIYEAAPGMADAMRARFRDVVVPRFFPKHGISLEGAWVAPEEDGRLTYMTKFADEASRTAAWASFGADEEWRKLKADSERDGPLLSSQTVSVLRPAFDPVTD